MPLFMDLHKFPEEIPEPSREQLYVAHMKDLSLQEKYGVKYMVYIVNNDTRSVFCIIDAPDAKSCLDLHTEAHGTTACHVVEVKGGDFINFLGDMKQVNEYDMLEISKGIPDTGFRTMLVYHHISLKPDDEFEKKMNHLLSGFKDAKTATYNGQIVIIFYEADAAIMFAIKLMDAFNKLNIGSSDELRIGLAAGEPVNEKSDTIFGVAIEEAITLCRLARNRSIMVSHKTARLRKQPLHLVKEIMPNIFFLSQDDDLFVQKLQTCLKNMENDPDFTIAHLAQKLGLSKSGLYRKVFSLTGNSVISLIQELKLIKAYNKIMDGERFLAEIAYSCDFKTPSYFTRSFRKRFGISPRLVWKDIERG